MHIVRKLALPCTAVTAALLASAAAVPTWSASFSCNDTSSQVEWAICEDPDLSSKDETIASLYGDLRRRDPSKDLTDAQRQWLSDRNRCQNIVCLREMYDLRLTQLSQAASTELSYSSADPSPSANVEGAEAASSPPLEEAKPVTAKPAASKRSTAAAPAVADTTSPPTAPAKTSDGGSGWMALIVVVMIFAGLAWLIEQGRSKRRRAAFAVVDRLVVEHAKNLALRRRQLIVADPYGTLILKAWQKEAAYFYKSIIEPRLSERQRQIVGAYDPYTLIESRLAVVGVDLSDLAPTYKGNDPVQYEHHCADILRDAGWIARVTKGSGDQGSDVIAEKAGVKIVLQCKLYTYPVGNKAVQEAAAARTHEGAHYAACVTNSSYTPAAQALAGTNAIALLHHDQLADWADGL